MIQRVFIENFKAIYKAANFEVQPFTVFIGNNGTGKSSIIEALRVLQMAVDADLNEAFDKWGGVEKVRNYNAFLVQKKDNESIKKYEPITIAFTALVNNKVYEYQVKINAGLTNSSDYYVVEHEELICNRQPVFVANISDNKKDGKAIFYKTVNDNYVNWDYPANRLWLGFYSPYISDELQEFSGYVRNWQFLYLNAHDMGYPIPRDRVNRKIKLEYDGRNIADHLLWLKSQGQEFLDNVVRRMRFVLPYLGDLQPHILEETINREVELLLYESKKESPPIPGWLLSSGTLRILALLTMFETPKKPSVLFIDEIENGLDPRTIALLLNQIESEVIEKTMQVIITTHSPYFLDLVPLESVIVTEKNDNGSSFHLPKDETALNLWKDKFSPGKLYTMGKLTQ